MKYLGEWKGHLRVKGGRSVYWDDELIGVIETNHREGAFSPGGMQTNTVFTTQGKEYASFTLALEALLTAHKQRKGIDFIVTDHGTIWQFQPVTERAKNFAETDLNLEPWQWLGNTFGLDRGIAHGLLLSLQDEGFVIQGAA